MSPETVELAIPSVNEYQRTLYEPCVGHQESRGAGVLRSYFCDLCIVAAFCNTQGNEYLKRVTLASWPSVLIVVKTVIPPIISATLSSHVLPLNHTTLTAIRPERPMAPSAQALFGVNTDQRLCLSCGCACWAGCWASADARFIVKSGGWRG
jgi:hypothetical protein